jgi:hypothetical protein|tara:strand:- start:3318 stop:3578 length:261 start_codon:yes stop_codon:yes gene_type:complete
MARRKYVPGALVEARNSRYGKGFGIIISGPTMDTKAASMYTDLVNPQEWFNVHWFTKPGNVDSYYLRRGNGRVDMTKNQIKVVRKR